MTAASTKAGAARLAWGMGDETCRRIERESLGDAAARARALTRLLEAAVLEEGPVEAELRYAVIAASRDLAERIRQVVL